MIHMLSAFDLNEGEDTETFKTVYDAFVKDLLDANVIVSASPIGQRVLNTPMDTDDERDQCFYSVMTFLNRTKLDAAYEYINNGSLPGSVTHVEMYRRISNSLFLCWEDQI